MKNPSGLKTERSSFGPKVWRLMEQVHSILSRAFSNDVIHPGKTTDQDVVWWLRQENQRLGFGAWFQPGLRVQRQNGQSLQMLQQEEAPISIERGDVLWVDYGLTAMRLATDTQHMGYVLKDGESAPPRGISAALENLSECRISSCPKCELKKPVTKCLPQRS